MISKSYTLSDYDLGQTCVGYCENDYLLCLQSCDSSDVNCLSTCGRNQIGCTESCPCNIDCIVGCRGCENPICPTRKSVLVLSTSDSSNVPVLINYDGGVNENLHFELDDGTEVYRSCSALLNGEFYVIGGGNTGYKDQVR